LLLPKTAGSSATPCWCSGSVGMTELRLARCKIPTSRKRREKWGTPRRISPDRSRSTSKAADRSVRSTRSISTNAKQQVPPFGRNDKLLDWPHGLFLAARAEEWPGFFVGFVAVAVLF
jgi:hypothetical protein